MEKKNDIAYQAFLDTQQAIIDQSDTWERVRLAFEFQARFQPLFSLWIEKLGRRKNPRSWEELTFLPIHFFQTHHLQSFEFDAETVFKSSGTSGQLRSQHFVHRLDAYHKCCVRSFEAFEGKVEDHRHLFYLPFYQANPHSSLINMTEHFLGRSQAKGSRYLTDLNDLQEILDEDSASTFLWTVTFGAMDLLDRYRVLEHPELTIIETGGSKGQRDVLPRTELHQRLKALGGGVTASSEYGMCELSHQAYYRGGVFHSMDQLLTMATELNDPFAFVGQGKRGRMCFIDLGNLHSCSFIETEDWGICHELHSFEVLGRIQNSNLRGCNLMWEE